MDRTSDSGVDPLGLIGTLIDGQFRAQEIGGRGELSVVYRGLHEGVDAPVAIKCLNLPITLDLERYEPLIESLREGARIHYQLGRRHAHIVHSVACGTTTSPRTGAKVPYLVREWLQGRSLASELAKQQSRRRSIREVMTLLDSAADALAFAHSQGIGHYALTPSSLFVAWTEEGPAVKVLDFGVGKVLNDHAAITAVGVREAAIDAEASLPCPPYAAPEQLDKSFGAIGPASDVFAFARILCEALAARPVVAAGTTIGAAVRALHEMGPPTALAMGVALGPELEAVLTRALATSPGDRFPDMRSFWDELSRAASRAPKSIAPAAPTKKKAPPLPARRAEAPSPPSYDRVSTTAEVAPAVSPPSAPAMPVASPRFALHEEEELDDADLLAPAGLDPSPMTRRLAAVGRTPRQQRIIAAGGAAALACIVGLLALTAPRAPASGREARLTSAHGAKVLVAAPTALKPGTVSLPADVVPAPPAMAVAPVPHPPGRFSAPTARAALAEASPDLAACIAPRGTGPRGPGSVRVRFNPSGKMAEAYLGPPYAGSGTGRCILERFSKVRVEPFVGVPMSVNYSFYTIPF